MPEAQAQQGNEQQQSQQQNQQQGSQQGEQQQAERRTFTQDEWDARQREFDSKADKIRRNAARDAERRIYREFATRPPQQQQQQDQRQQEQSAEPPKAPKREDFSNYEDYLVARAEFTARSASREDREAAEKASRERTVAEQRAKTQSDFKKRAEALMAEVEDFADVIDNAEGVMITSAMSEAIMESEHGPRILYHLATHADDAARIAGLSATAAVREIGKLEARIEADLKAKAAPKDEGKNDEQDEEQDDEHRSEERQGQQEKDQQRDAGGRFKAPNKRAAPAPIEPGSGRSASASATRPSDKDDIKDWMKKRDAEEAADRKTRFGR